MIQPACTGVHACADARLHTNASNFTRFLSGEIFLACLPLYMFRPFFFARFICLEGGAFGAIASQSPLSSFDKAEGELSACCRYKVAEKSLEMGRQRGIFWRRSLKRQDAAQCRIDPAVCLPSSWWLRQQWARFVELSSPGEAQQIGWLDSAHSPSSRRRGFTDMSAAIKQTSCLWY